MPEPGTAAGAATVRAVARALGYFIVTAVLTQRRLLVAGVFLAVVSVAVSACSQPDQQAPNFTIEEAGFLAKGELFRIYGASTDPVVVAVAGERATLDDRPVWALHLVVEVTEDGARRTVEWDVSVGIGPEGPEVLEAHQRP